MLPTPSTSHVSFDRVYEPSEDSFLFLDTISSDSETAFLGSRFRRCAESSNALQSPAPLVLEVGTGSGVILAFINAHCGRILGRTDVLTIGSDINSFACRDTIQTVKQAESDAVAALPADQSSVAQASRGCFLDTINADLSSTLRTGVVDVAVFNPPYVPTPDLPDLKEHELYNHVNVNTYNTTHEQESHLLELSYAGGVDGMEVTDRFFEELPRILHPVRGVAYILLCAQNKPDKIKKQIQQWGPDWAVETVGDSRKQAGWEKLQILRIWRTQTTGHGATSDTILE